MGHQMDIVPANSWPERLGNRAGDYDAVIVQKALLPGKFLRRLRDLGRPVYFDFDDAIWTRPRRPYAWWTQRRVNYRIRRWFALAKTVFAANEYLAEYARRFNLRVEVVPMALDLEIWRPAPKRGDTLTIGWAGSPANLWHLEKLEAPLRSLLRSCKQVKLAVFCGQKPTFEFPFEYVPYEPGMERDFVAGLDIGLLPLEYETYSLGKSPIKALQYLSCGVPVVGNAAGATAELLNPDNSVAVRSEADWLPALERLVASPDKIRDLGAAGRKLVERNHDLRTQVGRLVTFLARNA